MKSDIKEKQYSVSEYLNILEESLEKVEYHNGEIFDMAGGTFNHAVLCTNINGALVSGLGEGTSGCIPLNSECKVHIEKSNSYVFPDGMVVCGEVEFSKEDKNAIKNPVLVIEVLSKSTEGYDRGEKFIKYCSLPSFKEYVLIDQYQPIVMTLFREDSQSWNMMTIIGLDKTVHLRSLDLSIDMKTLYRNTQDLKNPMGSIDFEI